MLRVTTCDFTYFSFFSSQEWQSTSGVQDLDALIVCVHTIDAVTALNDERFSDLGTCYSDEERQICSTKCKTSLRL